MVNELKAHALKAQANSLELTPAINIIDAAIARMGNGTSDARLNKQRAELIRIRDLLQGLMDRSFDAEGPV